MGQPKETRFFSQAVALFGLGQALGARLDRVRGRERRRGSEDGRWAPRSEGFCHHLAVGQIQADPFWLVGEFTTHFRTYLSGDWDVHWGYGFMLVSLMNMLVSCWFQLKELPTYEHVGFMLVSRRAQPPFCIQDHRIGCAAECLLSWPFGPEV